MHVKIVKDAIMALATKNGVALTPALVRGKSGIIIMTVVLFPILVVVHVVAMTQDVVVAPHQLLPLEAACGH